MSVDQFTLNEDTYSQPQLALFLDRVSALIDWTGDQFDVEPRTGGSPIATERKTMAKLLEFQECFIPEMISLINDQTVPAGNRYEDENSPEMPKAERKNYWINYDYYFEFLTFDSLRTSHHLFRLSTYLGDMAKTFGHDGEKPAQDKTVQERHADILFSYASEALAFAWTYGVLNPLLCAEYILNALPPSAQNGRVKAESVEAHKTQTRSILEQTLLEVRETIDAIHNPDIQWGMIAAELPNDITDTLRNACRCYQAVRGILYRHFYTQFYEPNAKLLSNQCDALANAYNNWPMRRCAKDVMFMPEYLVKGFMPEMNLPGP